MIQAPSPLEKVLAKLPSARKSGGGYQARCPAHEDNRPSLSITEKNGMVLLKCWAGCGFGEIIRALGLEAKDLFPQDDARPARGRRRAREIIATYDYVDAAGKLLFQAVRYRPKDFRQRRPDGAGGWIWNLQGLTPVLYHLPEVLAAAREGRPVYLVEGERDADNLRRLGLAATTSPMGAGRWRAEYAEHLKGARVVVLPDNDSLGRKHAQDVARSLHGAATSIKVLELPGRPEKGDVSDWLEAGGTRDELEQLAKAAAEWQPVIPSDPITEPSRPEIDAGQQNLSIITTQAWEAVQAANNPPVLFRHGGIPTRLEQGDHGEPVLRPVTVDRLRHAAARSATWYRWKDDNQVDAMPPLAVVKDMLAAPELPLPILARVVESPVFAPDGSIVTEPGYHAGSGLYYRPAPGFGVPKVSERPAPGDVERARSLILDDLWGDFPFVGEAEQAHAVALMLLPFVRDMVSGPTPLHLVEKPMPGTGGTLMVDVATYVATGRNAMAMTEGTDEDEWRKRITATLRASPAVVLVDNLRRRLDSAALAAAITSTTWQDRLLGQSENLSIPVRCAWVASGNNPAASSEIARRTVRIRLDARQDRPWLRDSFRHSDLRGWVAGHRSEVVWAALTLGQHWITSGRPAHEGPTLGMFESWANTMGGILRAAGVPGFLGNLNEFYETADAEGSALRAFVGAWWDDYGDRPVGVTDLFALVMREAGLLDLGTGNDKSQQTRLGKLLGRLRDRQYGDLRVVSAGTYKRLQRWKLEYVGLKSRVSASISEEARNSHMAENRATPGPVHVGARGARFVLERISAEAETVLNHHGEENVHHVHQEGFLEAGNAGGARAGGPVHVCGDVHQNGGTNDSPDTPDSPREAGTGGDDDPDPWRDLTPSQRRYAAMAEASEERGDGP